MDLDEPVTLVPYDPRWPMQFDAERQRLRAMVPTGAVIEHIGSTSVPGLTAKPVIDILVGLPGLDGLDGARCCLVASGYDDCGEAGVTGRFYFRRRGVEPHCNAHVVALDGVHWKTNLALRDYLRASPAACRTYTDAKRAALATGGVGLLAYSEAKSGVLRRLIREALEAASP